MTNTFEFVNVAGTTEDFNAILVIRERLRGMVGAEGLSSNETIAVLDAINALTRVLEFV